MLPAFQRQVVYKGEPSERVLAVVGDLNRDGVPEIVIGARKPRPELYWLGRTPNGLWERYLIDDTVKSLEAGGCLTDLDGDGDLDFIGGGDYQSNSLYWWECPDDPALPWTRHEIFRMPANQSHDQLISDLDGDGRPELYFWNQQADTLFCVRVPDDPRVSPWPDVRPVVIGVREEGLAVADVDGDGRHELIAGQSWYRPHSDGSWDRHVYAEGYVSPRVAAADFDGDGKIEIVLAEGDASLHGREYGRAVLFRSNDDPEDLWRSEVLHDKLLDPHSVLVANFDGDGCPDLFVGELGDPKGNDRHPPSQRVFLNRDGRLQEQVIDSGVGTHESKLIELDGRIGIVGKPYRNIRDNSPRPVEVDCIYLWLPEAE